MKNEMTDNELFDSYKKESYGQLIKENKLDWLECPLTREYPCDGINAPQYCGQRKIRPCMIDQEIFFKVEISIDSFHCGRCPANSLIELMPMICDETEDLQDKI